MGTERGPCFLVALALPLQLPGGKGSGGIGWSVGGWNSSLVETSTELVVDLSVLL